MTQKITISVWETDAPVADSRYMACYDDYDLDCHTGTGHTPEEAVIELVSMWDLPKEINKESEMKTLITISLIAATLIAAGAIAANARVTCQTIGSFTYCNDSGGGSVTCQKIGKFTYCN